MHDLWDYEGAISFLSFSILGVYCGIFSEDTSPKSEYLGFRGFLFIGVIGRLVFVYQELKWEKSQGLNVSFLLYICPFIYIPHLSSFLQSSFSMNKLKACFTKPLHTIYILQIRHRTIPGLHRNSKRI